MNWRIIFRERLQRRRETLGWSKTELAKRVGITKVSIWGFEKGQKVPSVDTLIALADALDVSVDWLCGRLDRCDNKTNKDTSLEDRRGV